MSTELSVIEEVLVSGQLQSLTPPQRLEYYNRLCESLKLNPLTKPFEFITLNGKLTLYAKKDATEQLRKIHKISIIALETKIQGDVYIVTAHARSGDGREDISTGAVSIKSIAGEALANAYLKAETKAKRRVTLSIAGLGFMDEAELESIPKSSIRYVNEPQQQISHNVNIETGECEAPPWVGAAEQLPVRITQIELVEAKSKIMKATDMEELKSIYKDYYHKFQLDQKAIQAITIDKDVRKSELDLENM